MIIALISLSCRNFCDKTNLPKPPEKPDKYIIVYKGKQFKFNNDNERKQFCDSISISIDSIKNHFE